MNRLQRCIKEPFPALSHLVGAGLSVAGLVLLLVLARGRVLHLTGFSIYGITLILLYLASAAAHSLHCSPRMEDRLTRLDYAAIFLLIAGTYTPICLLALKGPVGWLLLAAIWGLALGGICTVFLRGLSNWPRVILYGVMTWLALVAAGELLRVLPGPAIGWLAAGGIIYSLGAIVFLTDRPHLWPGKFAAHDLWHVMALLASACHFICIAGFMA